MVSTIPGSPVAVVELAAFTRIGDRELSSLGNDMSGLGREGDDRGISHEPAAIRRLPRGKRDDRRQGLHHEPRAGRERRYRADSPQQDVPLRGQTSSGPKTWTAPAGSVTVTISPAATVARRGVRVRSDGPRVVSATTACTLLMQT